MKWHLYRCCCTRHWIANGLFVRRFKSWAEAIEWIELQVLGEPS